MKLGSEEIFYMNAFSGISGAVAKDVIVQVNSITYLVKHDDIGRAIGKNACNVVALRKKLKKNVEIIGQYDTVEEFIKKALYNVKIDGVEIQESEGKKRGFILLNGEEKGKLLNNLGRFKRIKEIAKRNYGLDDLRIK